MYMNRILKDGAARLKMVLWPGSWQTPDSDSAFTLVPKVAAACVAKKVPIEVPRNTIRSLSMALCAARNL